MRCHPSTYRGIAAIEFALVMLLLILILSGLFIYSLLLQTQQSVVRATGDGARLLQEIAIPIRVQSPTQRALVESDIRGFVRKGIRDAGLSNSDATKVDVIWAPGQATLAVEYPNPAGREQWAGMNLFNHLYAQAVVKLQVSP